MTIKIAQSRMSKYAAPARVYTGLQPSIVTGEAMRSTFLNLMNWKQNGQVLNYSGRYDPAVNGAYDSYFYIVTPWEDNIDAAVTTRKIGIEAQCWNRTTTGASSTTTFNPTWNTVDIFDADRTIPTVATQDDEIPPYGEYFKALLDYDNTNVVNGYTYNTLYIPKVSVASVCAYTLPDFSQTTEQAYRLASGNFGIGQTLRGEIHNSVGTMSQYLNNRSATTGECLVGNTRRCLFQWAHPAGYQYDGGGEGSLTYTDAWNDTLGNFKFKVKGRNLRGRAAFTTANTDVCMITRHDEDCAIRLTSAQTADTYTKTFTGTQAVLKFNVTKAALIIDPTGDEITVEVLASSSKKCEIKSLSLWEDGQGDEI